ncbi:rap guanine nucleotide exchange factor 2-like, partial [Tropilaelaps mercedesae]
IFFISPYYVQCLTVRDTYRECLEKDPNERAEEDIETLLDFMQHLPAFANMTLSVRRELCAVMVFAVVEKAGTVVMNDGEELDSWSVIVNGMVEVQLPDGSIHDLLLGDSFGITPTMEKMHHVGTMRTKTDDCQFVCIAQSEYYRILHQGEENTRKLEENGRVVLVTEHRVLDGGTRRGHVVIRGTPERLLAQLLDENVLDPGYIEDFLLTYRTFVDSPTEITRQMVDWFQDDKLRDRVTRVVLLWVNNHFTDFETDPDMMEFLEDFEHMLEECKKLSEMQLLNIACAAKARTRSITLARPNREEPLQFQIVGGYETGFDVFIAKVERGSKAHEVGLKRGDQILEVNGQSFTNISHMKALELFKQSTHLQISVRSNLMGLKEMATNPNRIRPRPHRKSLISDRGLLPNHNNNNSSSHNHNTNNNNSGSANLNNNNNNNNNPIKLSEMYDLMYDKCIDSQNCSGLSDKSADGSSSKKIFMTLGNRTKLKKALAKIMSKNASIDASSAHSSDDSLFNGATPYNSSSHRSGLLYHSHSNPDLSSNVLYCDSVSGEQSPRPPDFPEHVLKVYRADQTSKFLVVHAETTAREVVMLALREFGISDSSSLYSLCEVTVGEGGLIKQRRLKDQIQNLAERMELRSRYYLKNNTSQETLVPDNLAGELLRESQISFLQLNSGEVAIQLTLEDFKIFRQIEPTEYVDDLFEVTNSRYGAPMLSKFAELVNREMFWVVTQVVSEPTVMRRMRTIKQFIKLGRHFREYKNFNSMFAILSGLGHGAVTRLKGTWDKLPTKYHKIFQDMQEIMDPSRNMCRYRTLVTRLHPPLIPFYPVVRKDLTFIHYGNDTLVDNLVNFEKLRMVSKEVRSLMNMCSQPYAFPLNSLMLHQQQQSLESSVSASAVALALGGAGVPGGPRHRPSRKKSSAGPNPKKMFEEAQMVRRVKAYFSGLKVITDEDELHRLSLNCESLQGQPGANTPVSQGSGILRDSGSGGSAPPHPRRRHPSPTLSTTSSTSLASSTSEGKKTLGPKFGTDSPQAMRKLLALSEGVTKAYHFCHQVRSTSGRSTSVVSGSSVSPSPSALRKSSAESSLPYLIRGGSDSLAHKGAAALGLAMSIGVGMGVHSVQSVGQHHHHHHHGGSTTSGGSGTVHNSLHLSPESSSVTSLRRDHASVCSMSSIDSGVGPSSCSSTNSHLDTLGIDCGQQQHLQHATTIPSNSCTGFGHHSAGGHGGENRGSESLSHQQLHHPSHHHGGGLSGYQTLSHHYNPARFFGVMGGGVLGSGFAYAASGYRAPPFPHAIAVLPPLPPPHHTASASVKQQQHQALKSGNASYRQHLQHQHVTSGVDTTGNRGRSAKPFAPPLPPSDRVGRSLVQSNTGLPRSRSHEGVSMPQTLPVQGSQTGPTSGGYYQLSNEGI